MRKFLFFIGGFFLATLLNAQELHLVQTNLPPTAPFAQPLLLQYHFSHDPEYQAVWDKTALPKDFEIQDVKAESQSPGTTRFDIALVPFTLGKSTLTLSFQLKQGDTLLEPQSFPLPVEITPVKTFNDKKIREIRSPFAVRSWTWLIILLVVAALLFALYLWRKHRKATKNFHIELAQDLRPSHVIALSKIEALLQSGLWENAQYKVFYITIVDILREYLQRRFNLDVSAETSSELIAHIKTKEDLQAFVTSLRELLNESDLIKFAKAVPDEPQRNRHVDILRNFIQKTIPIQSPQEEAKK